MDLNTANIVPSISTQSFGLSIQSSDGFYIENDDHLSKDINKPSTLTQNINSIQNSNNCYNLYNQPAFCSSNETTHKCQPIVGASSSMHINTPESEPPTSTQVIQSANTSGTNNDQSVQTSAKDTICPCHNVGLYSKQERTSKIKKYSTRADSLDLVSL